MIYDKYKLSAGTDLKRLPRWMHRMSDGEKNIAHKRAFERMLENRKAKGLDSKWKNSEDVFHWWMEDPDIDGQLSMEFGEE